MSGSDLLGSLIGVLLALGLVLGLAVGFVWVLRRIQEGQTGLVRRGRGEAGAARLVFVRALPLGPRERVVLIEAEGERFLVGVGGSAVTLLARWPLDAIRPEARP
jgi:flagellar protein FliO/FliZ